MHFPAEKKIPFLQKNAVFGGHMAWDTVRSLEESPKESPGAFRPRGPKSVWNSLRRVSGVSKPETLPTLFQTLFGPRARRPRETLSETLRGFRARRAQETPLRGGRYPNTWQETAGNRGRVAGCSSRIENASQLSQDSRAPKARQPLSRLFRTLGRKAQMTPVNLECRKWGFKRWGLKEIRGYLRKKAFFLRFLDFPGAVWALRKRAKKAEKGRFRPISGKGGQTPLKPPSVTPPFAAAQLIVNGISKFRSMSWNGWRDLMLLSVRARKAQMTPIAGKSFANPAHEWWDQERYLLCVYSSCTSPVFRGAKSTPKNPPKIKKFNWTEVFSELYPLASWLVSQERRQKFAQTFRKSLHKRSVFLAWLDSEVPKRGWREGVGDQQRPKYSKECPPELCSPTPKGA